MVDTPADYRWSSYRSNAFGERGFDLVPHPEYMCLGSSEGNRREAYQSLFGANVDSCMIKDIREAVNKGLALGSDRFKDEIEANLRRRVRPAPLGRPRKQPKKKPNQKSLL
jgi:putative transposase